MSKRILKKRIMALLISICLILPVVPTFAVELGNVKLAENARLVEGRVLLFEFNEELDFWDAQYAFEVLVNDESVGFVFMPWQEDDSAMIVLDEAIGADDEVILVVLSTGLHLNVTILPPTEEEEEEEEKEEEEKEEEEEEEEEETGIIPAATFENAANFSRAHYARVGAHSGNVRFGLEVVLEDPAQRAKLFGRNVALYTNQVFVDARMNSAILGFAEATDFNFISMFAGEHGVRGEHQAGAPVPNEIDVETGVLVWTLYDLRAAEQVPASPTPDMLRTITTNIPAHQVPPGLTPGAYKHENTLIDVILFDLPSIGSITWTYLFNMADLMKSIVEFELFFDVNGDPKDQNPPGGPRLTYAELRAIPGHRIQLIVLDRPNPLGGLVVEGPIRDLRPTASGGIGTGAFWRFPQPSRYGMTLGEMAKMFVGEWEHNWAVVRNSTLNPWGNRLLPAQSETRSFGHVDMDVIPVQGWTRNMLWGDWDPTGSRFIMPSPNMPTWQAAFAYTGTVWHEGTNVGERGTTPVWTLLHAPYMNGVELAERLNRFIDDHGILEGVRYRAAGNTPINASSQTQNFPGRLSDGVEIHITDNQRYRPIDCALIHMLVMRTMYGATVNASPGAAMSHFWMAAGANTRIGNNVIRDRIQQFPINATDAQIIAEFHILRDIIDNGCTITGAPGLNDGFLTSRLLYLIPEYGSPNPGDWPLPATPMPTVTMGFENLLAHYRGRLQGQRIGLVANHTAINPSPFDLGHIVDILHADPNIDLTTLFAPAPGLRALRQDAVIVGTNAAERAYFPEGTSYTDIPTGLPVHRLGGNFTVPTAAQLANVDVLLFDMQESGVRFNSHIALLADIMKAAAEHGVELIVLDRPSMVDTATVDGPVAEAGFGYAIPIRHGMTIGELAMLLKNDLGHITGGTAAFAGLDLTVIRMSNFDPKLTPLEMNLQFISPYGGATQTNALGRISPIFIGSHHAALAYAAIGLVEPLTLFDGRGTTRSMEAIGAPFVGPQLVEFQEAMSILNLPGVGFRTIVHVPWNHAQLTEHGGLFANQPTFGLQLHIYDFTAFNSTETALALLTTMRSLFPGSVNAGTFPVGFDEAIGNTWVAPMILNGNSVAQIMNGFQNDLDSFNEMRLRNLLYIPDTTPNTITISPRTVTINDTNLSQTVTVGGTATNNITLDASALPAGVTAMVNQASGVITVTGVRPAAGQSVGTFGVIVMRGGIQEILTVHVNLTAVAGPGTRPGGGGIGVTTGPAQPRLGQGPTSNQNHTNIYNQVRDNVGMDAGRDATVLELPPGISDARLQGRTLDLLISNNTPLVIRTESEIIWVELPVPVLRELRGRARGSNAEFNVNITAINESGIFAGADISFTAGTNRVTSFVNPYTIFADLSSINTAGINPHRITAVYNSRNIGGKFDPATELFRIDVRMAGEFRIANIASLRRVSIQLDSHAIVDLANNTTAQPMDVLPVIVNDRTMLPVRFVAYALDAGVDWNPATAEVTLTLEGDVLTFAIGQMAQGMDVPAQIIQGRAMVPLRFISEFFGAQVNWYESTRTVQIIR